MVPIFKYYREFKELYTGIYYKLVKIRERERLDFCLLFKALLGHALKKNYVCMNALYSETIRATPTKFGDNTHVISSVSSKPLATPLATSINKENHITFAIISLQLNLLIAKHS